MTTYEKPTRRIGINDSVRVYDKLEKQYCNGAVKFVGDTYIDILFDGDTNVTEYHRDEWHLIELY